jgi:spermidine synthase
MVRLGLSRVRGQFDLRVAYFLMAACALAFCSLAYELILAKMIAELTGNPLLWENLSMGSFLLGLGARSLTHTESDDSSMCRRLIRTEVIIISAMAISVLGLLGAEMVYRIYIYTSGIGRDLWPFPPVWILGGFSQVAPFCIGWLSGFELLFFLHFKGGGYISRQEAKVLATYHIGALVATVSFPWFILKTWSPVEMTICITLINLAILLIVQVFFLKKTTLHVTKDRNFQFYVMVLMPLLGILMLALFSPRLEKLSRKNLYFNRVSWASDARGIYDYRGPVGLLELMSEMEEKPDVERIRTPYQVIDVVRLNNATSAESKGPSGTLHINGRFQIHSDTSQDYHQPMVHVPMALSVHAVRRILVLGGGDGALVREIRHYDPTVAEVVLVDIDSAMIRLAKTEPFLRALNDDALLWPKVNVVIGDAMAYLRQEKHVFDAIYLDITYPYEFDSTRFYSLEFFRLIGRRLSEAGFFVVGSPIDLIRDRHSHWLDVLYSTVHAAGFPVQVAINGKRDHFLLASKSRLQSVDVLYDSSTKKAHDVIRNRDLKVVQLERRPRADLVNSVMQPKALGVDDTFF